MPSKKHIESSEIPESDLLDQTIPIDPNDQVDTSEENQVAPSTRPIGLTSRYPSGSMMLNWGEL